MTERNKDSLRTVYGWVLAALTVIVGVLFIMQVQGVYHSSETTPYSVQSISEHFRPIALPFALWIVAIIGGGVLGYIFPDKERKPAAYVELGKTLARLKRRLPETGVSADGKKYATTRLAARIACVAVCIVATAMCLITLLDPAYQPQLTAQLFTVNNGAADRIVFCLPWIFAALIVCMAEVIFESFLLKKEIALVKTTIAENAKKGIKAATKEQKPTLWEKILQKFPFLQKEKTLMIVRVAVALIGVVLVVVGIFNGGMADVLAKAIRICTQCIGLG